MKILRQLWVWISSMWSPISTSRSEMAHFTIEEFISADVSELRITIRARKELIGKLESILKIECYKLMADDSRQKVTDEYATIGKSVSVMPRATLSSSLN